MALTYRQRCGVRCPACNATLGLPCEGRPWGEVHTERGRLAGLRYAPQINAFASGSFPGEQGEIFDPED